MWSPVANCHLGTPVFPSSAYRLLSNEPTYTVPSLPRAGEETTNPSVPVPQSLLPFLSSAQTLRSTEPTYAVPSGAKAGSVQTELPAAKAHFSLPFGVTAYS